MKYPKTIQIKTNSRFFTYLTFSKMFFNELLKYVWMILTNDRALYHIKMERLKMDKRWKIT